MVIKVDTTEMMNKMQEVSSVLLKQAEFQLLREMIDQFAEDQESVKQYEQFVEKQNALHDKEQQGLSPSLEETEEYEQIEAALYSNDTIRKFIYAQEEFNKVQQMISQFFFKTVELGRIPEPNEIKVSRSCGCGGSCGC